MRKLEDWITAYEEYTHETESSEMFNKWVAVSAIASVLEKKCWLQLGRLKVFPNMYIILVAEPGLARKSQAISYASELLAELNDVYITADSITSQALIADLENSVKYSQLPNGTILRHASLNVLSKEFESFLGNSQAGGKMLVTLTDLYDSGESPWKHRTKGSGSNTIPSVYLNILGATTPKSLETALNGLAVGGGLTSRILFIFSKGRAKRVAIPEITDRLVELKQLLLDDLHKIHLMTGQFDYSKEGKDYWVDWYEQYNERDINRRQRVSEFDGWYSRKPTLLQKVAIILAASRNSYKIEVPDIERAFTMVNEAEDVMNGIFYDTSEETSLGTAGLGTVMLRHIKENKVMAEKHLLQIMWRDVNEDSFDVFMDSLLDSKQVMRKFVGPNAEEGIWYYYMGDTL